MARLLRYLAVLAVALAVILAALPRDDLMEPSTTYSQRVLDAYGVDTLKEAYGSARNYTHKQVRRLYHELLTDVSKSVTALSSSITEEEQAELCSVLRGSVRQYTRSRDGSMAFVTDLFLQLRDSYTHGLRYLPLALREDVEVVVRERRFTLRRTLLTLKQTRDCAMPAFFGQCPSYNFLKEVRHKSDAEILGSCTMSNKLFDKLTS